MAGLFVKVYKVIKHKIGLILKGLKALLVQMSINLKVKKIKIKHKGTLKVAFMVVYDSVFPLERVFKLMLNDPMFDPEIIVIPDMASGNNHRERVMSLTLANLKSKYGASVISSRNRDGFRDFCGKYDLYTTMNPYSTMTYMKYGIQYMAQHGCIVFSTRYFYDTGTVYSLTFNSLGELSYLWRFYAQNPDDKDNIERSQRVLSICNRVKAVGTPKMDDFVATIKRNHSRKCVIIAPHHSIDPIGSNRFSIGNFDRYSESILELPSRYPQIDWVFRPHPLTIRTMVTSGRWTDKEAKNYIERMTAYSNVEYQSGGEYWETFNRADALIQDCSSFLPEWYYTGKPQCFVLKDKASVKEQFLPYGQEMLSHVYKAYCNADVIDFIERVILGGEDYMVGERRAYAQKLMYNYLCASEAIMNDIKRSLSV